MLKNTAGRSDVVEICMGRRLEPETFDVIVIGAGAGGMTAAAVSAALGMRVLILEKTEVVGGTTAVSGGMVWIPANSKMAAAGRQDSRADADAYLRHTLPADFRPSLLRAFLDHADHAVRFLEQNTQLRFRVVKTYPDYFPDAPGATLGGRVLEPVAFDARALGNTFALLRPPLPEFTLFGGMMVDRADIPHFRRAGSSFRSSIRVVGLVGRYLWQRLSHPRGTTLVLGNALAGRLLSSLRSSKVDIQTNATVERLIVEDTRIAGVVCRMKGRSQVIRAARGVVLATGGFSQNAAHRAALLPGLSHTISAAAPGNTGDGLDLALACGAALREGRSRNAFWTPASVFHRHDGTEAVFPHTVTDRGKPGFIAVNQAGRRFVNEACSYHAFATAMMESGVDMAYLVCDRPALRRYGLGALKPFAPKRTLDRFLRSGDILSGTSIAELAQAIGAPAAALQTTIEDYNAGAVNGVDTLFGRGSNAYQRHMGDADHLPNPCVAPLAKDPFYAVKLVSADLGTAAGLATDEAGRVLREDGSAIPGLYACGADMSSVMEGAYVGPGITLGPALTFGYLAARSLAQDA